MTLTQGDPTVSEFFDKVNLLLEKVTKLDVLHPINEMRMRRIIIQGLRHKFNPIIATTRGKAREPTLSELEKMLDDEETLNKHKYRAPEKDEEKQEECSWINWQQGKKHTQGGDSQINQ